MATITSATGAYTVTGPTGIPGQTGNGLFNWSNGVGPFTADFSSAVTAVSINGGDYGVDKDHIYLAAYSGLNGTGRLLGSITGSACCYAGPASETVSLALRGIRSVEFYTGSRDAFPGSVFFSDLTVGRAAGAPEPVSWALIVAGFGGLGAALRSRRRSADALGTHAWRSEL